MNTLLQVLEDSLVAHRFPYSKIKRCDSGDCLCPSCIWKKSKKIEILKDQEPESIVEVIRFLLGDIHREIEQTVLKTFYFHTNLKQFSMLVPRYSKHCLCTSNRSITTSYRPGKEEIPTTKYIEKLPIKSMKKLEEKELNNIQIKSMKEWEEKELKADLIQIQILENYSEFTK